MNFHILLQNILAENADSNAIIHQKELNSISTLTYKDVSDIAASFYNRIEGTIKKCSCIGLLMKPNIFIPSLLIRYSPYFYQISYCNNKFFEVY